MKTRLHCAVAVRQTCGIPIDTRRPGRIGAAGSLVTPSTVQKRYVTWIDLAATAVATSSRYRWTGTSRPSTEYLW